MSGISISWVHSCPNVYHHRSHSEHLDDVCLDIICESLDTYFHFPITSIKE